MITFLTGVSCPFTRDADRPDLGLLVTPASSVHRQIEHYAAAGYGADNGCYVESKKGRPFDAERWLRWLDKLPREGCRFVALPDVLLWHEDEAGRPYCVGDLAATLDRSARYVDAVAALGFPPVLVAQDGLRTLAQVPFAAKLAGVFIGGSDEYKLGPDAAALIAECKAAGLYVHAGRVNSLKRLRYFEALGADSADGTYIGFKPSLNAPKVAEWLDTINGEHERAATQQLVLAVQDAARPGDVIQPTQKETHDDSDTRSRGRARTARPHPTSTVAAPRRLPQRPGARARVSPARPAGRGDPRSGRPTRARSGPAMTGEAPQTALESRIWAAWNALADECASPVHTIAARLGLEPEAVAFVVYPADTFGPWSDDDEPEGIDHD